MPQIKITILEDFALWLKANEKAKIIFKRMLIAAVEKGFGLEGKNDVVITIVIAFDIEGEAPIQFEINFTVGEAEYELGKIFNPTKEERELVDELIAIAVDQFFEEFKEYGLAPTSYSVWIMPKDNTTFKTHERSA